MARCRGATSPRASTAPAAAEMAVRRQGGDDPSGKPKVVIVGGQFAGRRAARLLGGLHGDGQFDVTMVDAKGFWAGASHSRSTRGYFAPLRSISAYFVPQTTQTNPWMRPKVVKLNSNVSDAFPKVLKLK